MSLIPSPYDPPTEDAKFASPEWPKPTSVTSWFDYVQIAKIKPKDVVGQCKTFPTIDPVLGFDPWLVRTRLRKFMTSFGHQIGCSGSGLKNCC